jgi:3-deoxy-D-arabino-heptulosonate 7-phosphate (DAHP) synthase class II
MLLTAVVNPDRIPGKVTVIGRYGADKVEQYLPGHIDAVKGTDHVVVWQCDAMVSQLSALLMISTESKC